MNEYKFKRENMKAIKNGFSGKIQGDAEYRADIPRGRVIRKSSIIAIAATVAILTTALCAVAVGVDPMAAWQSLFEKEAAIEVGGQVTSEGISMNVQNLYTDGNHAILKMTLRDLEGDRLSEEITIASIDESKYTVDVVDSSYNTETGEVTCIVDVDLQEEIAADGNLNFTVNSIIVNLESTDDYQSFDYDLYEAAVASELRPTISHEAWQAAAVADRVPAAQNDTTFGGAGLKVNVETNEYASMDWLPLDTSVQGEELIHWLSVLGVSYEDDILHVQFRYNDLFGFKYQYLAWNTPVLVDDVGNIIVPGIAQQGEWHFSNRIFYGGYQEIIFDIGDIENLKNLKLAWMGNHAGRVVDGKWSVNISLDSVGDSISGSTQLSDHPDFSSVSYRLSPVYLEAAFQLNDYDLDREKIKEIVYKEFVVVLKDGTRIEPEIDRNFGNYKAGGTSWHHLLDGFSFWQDPRMENTGGTSWNLLDGSFDIEDVAEVIVFGVSFTLE